MHMHGTPTHTLFYSLFMWCACVCLWWDEQRVYLCAPAAVFVWRIDFSYASKYAFSEKAENYIDFNATCCMKMFIDI